MTVEPREQKRARFIAEKEEIEITGCKEPEPGQVRDADLVLGKILKNRKRGENGE